MKSDAFIKVECDKCGDLIEIPLTVTGRGYDDRNVERALKNLGWQTNDFEDICDSCREDEDENEEP